MNIRNQVKAEKACTIRSRIKPQWKYTKTYVEITLRVEGEVVFRATRDCESYKYAEASGAIMKQVSNYARCDVQLRFFEA